MMTRSTMRAGAARIIVGLTVALALSGCAKFSAKKQGDAGKLVIPDYPSAREQYGFAMMYQKSQVASTVTERRNQQLDREIQCFQKVVTNFPDDTVHTPMALMNIGDAEGIKGDLTRASQFFAEAKRRWPNDDFVQARTSYSEARVLDQRKEFAAAKTKYKEIMDTYGNHPDPKVSSIAKRASALYYKLRQEPGRKTTARRG
jgi:tetratricopeptide (TPR) repeat protein